MDGIVLWPTGLARALLGVLTVNLYLGKVKLKEPIIWERITGWK